MTLNKGWKDLFPIVNKFRKAPNSKHEYIGRKFEAVIFGQRIGSLLKESVGDDVIWKPLIENLVSLLEGSPHLDEDVKRFYLSNGFVSSNFIVISELREAPAIGAGVDVYLHYKVGG